MRKFNFKILLLLSSGHMVVDIYQGAVPAVLPFLKENLGLSYTLAGVILIVMNTTSSIIQPIFGLLSDKKEKAFLLPLGASLAGAGFALLPLTGNFPCVLLLVAISGLGIASYHPEGYKTARFFTGDKMATGMSVFSVGGNTGLAVGPLTALSIVNYLGFSSLSWMFLPSLIFTVAIILLHRAISIPKLERTLAVKESTGNSREAYQAFFVILGVAVVRTWIQAGLMTYIPFYYIDYLKVDPVFAGKLVSLLLFGGAFGTLAGAPLADRWGHRFWLRFSMLACLLLFPLLFLTQGFLLFFLVTLFGALLSSTFSVTVVMGQCLFPHNLGVTSGMLVGFAVGAGGIGVTLLGVIADHLGVPLAMRSIGVLPVAGLLLTLLLRYPLPQKTIAEVSA
jgi:FSR family fosmidomycin resistance protein-like MFS transporter